MANERDKTKRLLQESPVNPRTGQVWTPADSEFRISMDEAKRELLKTQTSAAKFLKANGFLTPTGKLPKKYGG